MTDRTQPSLLDLPPARDTIRRPVRGTSRAQYRDALDRIAGRQGDVLRWLTQYLDARGDRPTAQELLRAAGAQAPGRDQTARLLYVRRGLSDLQASGLVERAGQRPCRESGRVCSTWRVRQR